MMKSFLLLCALAILFLPQTASAQSYTFFAPKGTVDTTTGPGSGPNQVDLDHHRAYTWDIRPGTTLGNDMTGIGLDSFNQSLNFNLPNAYISSASITFHTIRNWNSLDNRFYLHLLDTAKTTSTNSSFRLEGSPNGNGQRGTIRSVGDDSNSQQTPEQDFKDYFKIPGDPTTYPGRADPPLGSGTSLGNGLVSAGTRDTRLTTMRFSDEGYPNNNSNTDGAPAYGLPDGWSFANGNYTFTFNAEHLALLNSYFAGGFAFGFDPDCHFWNSGITFNMHVEPIPEPSTLLLVGISIAGIGVVATRRVRQGRDVEVTDA